MKRMSVLSIVLLACLVLVGSPAHSETRKMAWLRRSLAIAACATSAYDGYLSAKYLDGHHGLYEKNGFFANPDGTIRTGRMVGLKAGFCLVPAIGGEFIPSEYRPVASVLSGSAAGLFTFVDLHNLGLIRKQELLYPEAFK